MVGPTGSGKTTTLYSVLKSLNDEDVNITTIEDPIEIKLEGINQSQINAKAGITFASCMRAILRQDPDIILVGEIRDYETLEIAISAALTGHLVLSTVHTNSAAATVTRMVEMGAKDYLVASTLSGVIAQRLVRRLCDDCKEEYYPTREEVAQITMDEAEIEELTKTPLYRAKGCNKCGFGGYKGRLGIYEIMGITKGIRKLIASGAHDIEIEEAAVQNGMTTLSESCKGHIRKGMTTIDEYVRVLGLISE
jgi:type IV pilus assembly protein PilB